MAHACMLLALMLLPLWSAAADVPEPLSWSFALASATNANHPDLAELDAELDTLRAELGILQGESGFNLDLRGRLRQVGLSEAAPSSGVEGDSAASLVLSKPLYDFGRQGLREQRSQLRLRELEWRRQYGIEQRRLDIIEAYLAVLDADNEFISANEAMAIGFIRYNNAVEDRQLGRVDDIGVLELQSAYEKIRQARYLAVDNQRLARSRLAEVMGYPGQLSSDLETPDFDIDHALPEDVEALVEQALRHSAEARLAATRVQTAQAEIAIAGTDSNPSLDFEVELSSYQRDGPTRDDWRASVYFDLPLYSATSTPSKQLAQSRHRQALAEQRRVESRLRLEVLRLWQRIQHLRLQFHGATVERSFRDRHLDRSRAEYELEFKTDLGNSMVEYSRSNTERKRILYAHELTYRRLARLIGEDDPQKPPR